MHSYKFNTKTDIVVRLLFYTDNQTIRSIDCSENNYKYCSEVL